jgi:hypothetical protein
MKIKAIPSTERRHGYIVSPAGFETYLVTLHNNSLEISLYPLGEDKLCTFRNPTMFQRFLKSSGYQYRRLILCDTE